jgi:hypothetical protein
MRMLEKHNERRRKEDIMKLKTFRWCVPIALMVVLGSLVAHADGFYNSKAAWTAALAGSPTTINFEGIAPASDSVFIGYGPGANTTVGGVNFAVGTLGTDSIFFILGDGNYGYPKSLISLQPTTLLNPADLLITLPRAVTALGFDFGTLFTGSTAGGDGTESDDSTNGGAATITLSDDSVQTVGTLENPDFAFFGVTAAGGISSVDISVAGTYGLDLADFSYGTAGPTVTPEPGTILLLGTGLVGLVGVVRRKMGFRA